MSSDEEGSEQDYRLEKRWWKPPIPEPTRLDSSKEPKTWDDLVEKEGIDVEEDLDEDEDEEDDSDDVTSVASSVLESANKDRAVLTSDISPNQQNGLDEEEITVDPLLGFRLALSKDISSTHELAKIFFTHEEYNPSLYLSTIHRETPFTKLREGYNALGDSIKSRTESIKVLVRENFSRFVSCKDTIDGIHETLLLHKQAKAGTPSHVANEYTELEKEVKLIFDKLLNRKQEADKIRKQLTIINSYQYIFSMPVKIQKNIEQGKGEKVLADYKKILEMLNDSQISIFQRVLLEIQKMVDQYSLKLLKNVNDISKPLEETEKTIRLLVEFRAKDDPVWHYMSYSRDEVCRMMSLKASAVKSAEKAGRKTDKIIKDISVVLLTNLPKHWKLTESIISGNFFKSISIDPRKDNSTGAQKHSDEDYRKLLKEIMQQYSDKVRSVIFGEDELIKSAYHLDDFGTLKESSMDIAKCYDVLRSLQMPSKYYEPVSTLVNEVIEYYVSSIFQNLTNEISIMYSVEEWKIEKKANTKITKLPTQFVNLMLAVFAHLEGVVSENHAQMDNVHDYILESIRTFADCLHHLGFAEESQIDAQTDIHQLEEDKKLEYRDLDFFSVEDQKLVLTLSNCHYTMAAVVPELERSFAKILKLSNKPNFDDVNQPLSELETMLLNRYIRNKTVALNAFIKKGMLLSGIDWQREEAPTTVNKYVLDALLFMVFIHQEVVHTLEPNTTQKILSTLTAHIFQSYIDCLDHIPQFTKSGLKQLEVDIGFIEIILKPYIPGLAKDLLGAVNDAFDAVKVITTKTKQGTVSTDRILEKVLFSTKIMFECFL